MRDVCRNFQRGSCQYGERCRYLHVQQQPQRISNSPAFASHQNTNTNNNKNNPFGFGAPQQHNQFKPFENKWNRSNPQKRQPDNNSQPVNHECTDPQACKRQITEDFQQEKPLWILTCYSHCKGAACDIVGDVSYEELRAAAYEDAKKGMSLQLIVEKERNILKSKLVEFEKLLSEPYTKPLNSSLDSQNRQSIGANANPFSRTTQNGSPLSVSSFSQLGASLNMGSERPSAPIMNTPAQTGFFGNGGTQTNTPAQTGFFGNGGRQTNTPAQTGFFGNGGTQTNTPAQTGFFGNGGTQTNTPMQPSFFGIGGNSSASNTANLSNRGFSGAQNGPNSTPAEFPMFPGSTTQKPPIAFNDSSSFTMFQTASDVQLLNKPQVENVSGDASIWLKEKWNPGEIPEEAPPDAFIR